MTKMALQSWLDTNQPSTIDSGEVHIFCVSMNQPGSRLQEFFQALSSNEVKKKDRFHFVKDRDRYVIRHGVLRKILGSYLDVPACSVDIEYTEYGKPIIMGNNDDSWLQFNLTSSRDLALIAVTRMNPIGVDLEYMIDDFPYMDIALKYFSSGEMRQLYALPEESHKRAFFDGWARKEAYVKARGEGLSIPLDRFEVSICPGDRAELLHHDDDLHESFRWSLQAIDLGDHYAAAFAVEGPLCECTFWDLR